MFSFLIPYIQKKHVVKQAKSRFEKESIFRLRYDIYRCELNKKNVECSKRSNDFLVDYEDKLDNSYLFYLGDKNAPVATFRLTIYDGGNVPVSIRSRYSLGNFPELSEFRIVEMSRGMISNECRKGQIMLSMAIFVYQFCVREKVEIGFLYCAPGLSKFYKLFGYRPYRANILKTEDGIRLPMINVFSDYSYYSNVRSPLKQLVRKKNSSLTGSFFDVSLIEDRLVEESSPYMIDEAAICETVLSDIDKNNLKSPFFKGIDAKSLKLLLKKGVLISVNPGEMVLSEGIVEKELYVVLNGALTVLSKRKRKIAELKKGDVFGEVAFFNENGERSASILANEKSTLLMFSRNFLERISSQDKDMAIQLLFNLSTVLANRLALENLKKRNRSFFRFFDKWN